MASNKVSSFNHTLGRKKNPPNRCFWSFLGGSPPWRKLDQKRRICGYKSGAFSLAELHYHLTEPSPTLIFLTLLLAKMTSTGALSMSSLSKTWAIYMDIELITKTDWYNIHYVISIKVCWVAFLCKRGRRFSKAQRILRQILKQCRILKAVTWIPKIQKDLLLL